MNPKKLQNYQNTRSEKNQPKHTEKEFQKFTKIAIKTIKGEEFSGKLGDSESELKDTMEQVIIESVKELPEKLAKKLGTVDPVPLNKHATELLTKIKQENNKHKLSDLQKELIFQYITLISRVQNGGDKGFLRPVALEVNGLDCSLSAWALKEKLTSAGIPDLWYEFGYPSGHAIGIISVADGRKLYVDAQNGFVAEIETQQVHDKKNPYTAYPIYKITKHRFLTGHVPYEGEVFLTRPNGSNHLPTYLGIHKSGLLHTLGNFHMLVYKKSPIYNTKTAEMFRNALNNDPNEWKNFQRFIDKIAGGKVIQETKFGKQP